jgi:hypothetical protein
VGEDLAVLGELELAPHEAIRELAGVDRERADVARDLFVVLARAFAEHHFEHPVTGLCRWAVDQRDEVR